MVVYIDVGLGVTGKHMCTKGSSMVWSDVGPSRG
jgi:hypothetical protein